MSGEVVNYSDLYVSIEVWFRVLQFFEPQSDWSWHHPALQEWMTRHGYRCRSEVPPAGLWLINWSLERKYHYYDRGLALTGQEIV